MNDKEVFDFITLQRKTGAPDEKIKEFLKEQGMSGPDIDKSLELVDNMQDEKLVQEARKIEAPKGQEQPRIKTAKYWIIFLIMIILLGVTGLIYLFFGPR